MALQVWLPLNGNIENKGLSDISVTNVGATVNSGGKIGKCYYFNGSSQYLQFDKSLPNLYCEDFSWALWVKPTDDSRGILISEYASTGSSNVALELLANRQIRVYWDQSPDWSTGVYVNSNVWSHIAVTKSENLLKVYVNGELKATGNYTLADKTSSSKIRIGDDYRGGTAVSYQGYLNDVRIYNHCLSPKEVKEISKGLVLHYKMDDGCLKTANNLVTGLTGGGQCTISNNIVTVSGSNSDTYFYLNTSAALTSGKTYKISCIGNFDNGKYYYFPIGGQSNTSPGQLLVKNGYCSLVFTANSTIQNNGTKIIMDDISRSPGAGTITNIMLEEVNGIYDCSGFGYNSAITSTTAPISDSDSPRYNNCFNFDTTGKYITCPVIDFSGMSSSYSFAWWGKTPSWDGLMYWGFVNGNRLNYYSGYYWNTGDGSNNPFYSSGTTTITRPSINVWHHYVVTGNGSATKLYVDGNLYGTAKTNQNITGTQIYIHGWDSSVSYKNAGDRISDFRIYATPLSAEDVKELYNTSAIICNNGTVMAYSLEE